MKSYRIYFVLAALIICGGLIGFYLSFRHTEPVKTTGPEEARVYPDFAEEFDADTVDSVLPEPPPGAVSGEFVLHFSDREDYLAYLEALRAAGLAPLGQIDALLAVRIPQNALHMVDAGRYGAEASYSYRVESPLPPVEIDPAALAGLRAYGISAREIVKGTPQGDGSGVKVAILDSGMQAHPQFENVKMMKVDLSGVGVSGPGASHGTSVASILSGSEGIVPQAELIVVRVLDDQGLGDSYHVAEGIVQAVDLGAKVINLSLGVYQDSPVLRQAVNYASNQGVLLVAAAGNDGYDRMPYPAAYEEVLSVTALDAMDNQAIFPNQSNQIDFAAPGIGIRTANEDEGDTLFSGTSAAAPFVSGTLASLMSGDDAMSGAAAVQLMKRYLNDAGAPGADPVYGAGVLDWDRLRERDNLNIFDLALSSIYLSPDALPGTNMPVEVTVQNRGTKWLNGAQLEVLINDAEPVTFGIGILGPGQITTRKVYAQMPSEADSEETLNLAARILPEDLNQDIRLKNNFKIIQYRPN